MYYNKILWAIIFFCPLFIYGGSSKETNKEITISLETSNKFFTGLIVTKDGENFAITCAHPFQNTIMVAPGIIVAVQEDPNLEIFAKHDGKEIRSRLIEKDDNLDLALIYLTKPITKHSINFTTEKCKEGIKVYHYGNFIGIDDLYTEGVFSKYEKNFAFPNGKVEVIIVDCQVGPGSSGGGVFLDANDNCLGMVKAQVEPSSISMLIPTKTILDWIKTTKYNFLFTDKKIPCKILKTLNKPAKEPKPPKPPKALPNAKKL